MFDRNWFYGILWVGGGIAALSTSLWLITLIRWGWDPNTASQRLTILGNALYGTLATNGLVVFGLTMRSAIRNFKGTAGSVSIEASSDKEDSKSV